MAPTGTITPQQAGYDVVKTARMSPENYQMINQLRGQMQPGVTSGVDFMNKLAGGGDENFWQQLEAPAMRQFSEFQDRTANRFSGMGMGSRRSSGFNNAMSSGAVDLAEQLQSRRMGLQQNAIKQLLGLYSGLMGEDEFQYDFEEKPRKNRWGGALTGAMSGAQAGTALMPGWGTAIGGIIGGGLGYFGGS